VRGASAGSGGKEKKEGKKMIPCAPPRWLLIISFITIARATGDKAAITLHWISIKGGAELLLPHRSGNS